MGKTGLHRRGSNLDELRHGWVRPPPWPPRKEQVRWPGAGRVRYSGITTALSSPLRSVEAAFGAGAERLQGTLAGFKWPAFEGCPPVGQVDASKDQPKLARLGHEAASGRHLVKRLGP